ncbi:hypothetical protein [Paraburkholderia sp. HP33-1]|uniref:hypothetical protein n=1 Tax=Paraburkholderia sp. HP33-1 TaxID=2883243 RepID=UPI001F428207|nr:hypothetical protein [Paraburkholderia sp. HP33-1]
MPKSLNGMRPRCQQKNAPRIFIYGGGLDELKCGLAPGPIRKRLQNIEFFYRNYLSLSLVFIRQIKSAIFADYAGLYDFCKKGVIFAKAVLNYGFP